MLAPGDQPLQTSPAARDMTKFDGELRSVQQEAQTLCATFAAEAETLRLTLANPALSAPERQRAVSQTRTATLQMVNRMTGFLSKLTEMSR